MMEYGNGPLSGTPVDGDPVAASTGLSYKSKGADLAVRASTSKMRRLPQQLLSLPEGEGPLYLKLYHRIRTLILNGSWPTGTQLPSTRRLGR